MEEKRRPRAGARAANAPMASALRARTARRVEPPSAQDGVPGKGDAGGEHSCWRRPSRPRGIGEVDGRELVQQRGNSLWRQGEARAAGRLRGVHRAEDQVVAADDLRVRGQAAPRQARVEVALTHTQEIAAAAVLAGRLDGKGVSAVHMDDESHSAPASELTAARASAPRGSGLDAETVEAWANPDLVHRSLSLSRFMALRAPRSARLDDGIRGGGAAGRRQDSRERVPALRGTVSGSADGMRSPGPLGLVHRTHRAPTSVPGLSVPNSEHIALREAILYYMLGCV